MFDPQPGWIIPEEIGAAEVRLPFLEARSNVEKDDVAGFDRRLGWILLVWVNRIRSRPHYPLVPIFLDSEEFKRQVIDLVIEDLFADACANQAPVFHLLEELRCLGFRFSQLSRLFARR